MGLYQDEIECLICPIGYQIILGTPWFGTGAVTFNLEQRKVNFTPKKSNSQSKSSNTDFFRSLAVPPIEKQLFLMVNNFTSNY